MFRSAFSRGPVLNPVVSSLVCKRCLQSIKVGIIGSGPAGFYTVQRLLKDPRVHVDIYEKYPVPFGLVRYGVAPDHQSIKNVINSFTNTALAGRVSFYGNISVGTDITLKELRKAYHVIVLSYGAGGDKRLNIDGEDLENVISARRFVGWYNGKPEDANLKVNLKTESVVIIGHGNVALDCARILLSPAEDSLKSTDITEHAFKALKESLVKNVYIVGRRGPLQVSFSIKELRELTKVPNVDTVLFPSDFESITSDVIENLPRPKKRLIEFLHKLSQEKNFHNNNRRCIILFHRSPLQIKGDRTKSVDSVILGLNNLQEVEGQVKTILTDKREEIRCGLLLKSIGYKVVSIDPSIPLNEKTNIIENVNGKITGVGFGLFCTGWAAVGATGVIVDTMNSSFEIADNILREVEDNIENLVDKPGSGEILNILRERNVDVATFSDWQKIDQLEKDLGREKGKIREKLIDISPSLYKK